MTIITDSSELPTGSIGKCGKGVAICAEGLCCSKRGFCGSTDFYCGEGCQSEYGSCHSPNDIKATTTTTTTTTTTKTTSSKRTLKTFSKLETTNIPDTDYADDTTSYSDSQANSSGKISSDIIVCIKGFCFNKYGLWFISSLISFIFLNGILLLY